MFESTRPWTRSGWSSAYWSARQPPHDWPSSTIRSSPNASRTPSSSATKRSTRQSDGSSSGRSERPAAELVVEQHGQLVAGQLLEPPQVLERDPGAAVEHDERDRPVAVALDVELVPPVDARCVPCHARPRLAGSCGLRRDGAGHRGARAGRAPRGSAPGAAPARRASHGPAGSAPSSPRSEASSAHRLGRVGQVAARGPTSRRRAGAGCGRRGAANASCESTCASALSPTLASCLRGGPVVVRRRARRARPRAPRRRRPPARAGARARRAASTACSSRPDGGERGAAARARVRRRPRRERRAGARRACRPAFVSWRARARWSRMPSGSASALSRRNA